MITSDQIILKRTSELSAIIPGVVWSMNKPFKLIFKDFAPLSPKLNSNKLYTSDMQSKSYQRFLKYPNKPLTYVVSSNPDYSAAMLFAAHLVDIFVKKMGSSRVLWQQLNQFTSNQLSYDMTYKPSLLVLSTIYTTNSYSRLELVRDAVAAYHMIPKIIVASGTDPISAACDILNIPVQSIFYREYSTVESKVKVY